MDNIRPPAGKDSIGSGLGFPEAGEGKLRALLFLTPKGNAEGFNFTLRLL
jgi:hypothetical protein